MTASALRRGWCPGMLRPMPTGDGLLVRLHPRAGILSADQAGVIAEAASRYGNGLLDVTGRGNLQIRGVSDATHGPLAEALMNSGLTDGARSEGPFRLTLTSPFAGFDPHDATDALALAEGIEAACASVTGLAPKTCVAVDGGGLYPLDDVEADLRVVALGSTAALGIAVTHGTQWLGTLPMDGIPGAIRRILTRLSALQGDGDGEIRRLRDLPAPLWPDLVAGLPLGAVIAPPVRPAAPRAGSIPTGDGTTVLLALPYGRCQARTLAQAGHWSDRYGTGEIRLSPGRAIAIPQVADGDLRPLLDAAERLDLIGTHDDPRLSVSACPGAPACARGSTPTHADADAVAAGAGQLIAQGMSVHVSGCPKGCAHPGPAALTLVGSDGAYEVVLHGTARDKPAIRLTREAIVDRLRAADDATGLTALLSNPSSNPLLTPLLNPLLNPLPKSQP
ncbi:precorrin-3B synthase [Microvirga pudoricolor]|uniref:precorrin-3B synthase n=1 Tax=Microvirga pudoricolor TaxID=2778729 RepID=UPI00195027D2|nr:precorrin-3B synthase [Microvirga pudoricolor]MBM6592898.1 precorrin-3B synthase [Microvirga pudoricolor]